MRSRVTACWLWALLLLGCGAAETHVAGLAVYDLDCPPDQILVTRRAHGVLVAKGCGRSMRYHCASTSGARDVCDIIGSPDDGHGPPTDDICARVRVGEFSMDVANPPAEAKQSRPLPTSPPPEAVKAAFLAQHWQLRWCYWCSLREGRPSIGRASVKITIANDGTVVDAAFEDAAARDPLLEDCATARMRTWRFPRWQGMPRGVLRLALTFSRVGDLEADPSHAAE